MGDVRGISTRFSRVLTFSRIEHENFDWQNLKKKKWSTVALENTAYVIQYYVLAVI